MVRAPQHRYSGILQLFQITGNLVDIGDQTLVLRRTRGYIGIKFCLAERHMHICPFRRGSGQVLVKGHRYDASALIPVNRAVHHRLALAGNGPFRLVVNRSQLVAVQNGRFSGGFGQLIVEFIGALQIVMLS
ncbi:hypothetical protein D3C73_1313730 [compost metagenome]